MFVWSDKREAWFPFIFPELHFSWRQLRKLSKSMLMPELAAQQVVERALREDLKQRIRYEVSYIRNNKGKVIIDRRFNTSSLMNLYMGRGAVQEESVKWDPEDPNKLFVQLPGLPFPRQKEVHERNS